MTFKTGFTMLVGLIMFSCSDPTIKNNEINKSNENITRSDSIRFANLIGKWTLKEPNVNVNFKTFIIDSSGFNYLTNSSVHHYKLLVEGDKFCIGIFVTENRNLITYYSQDTLKIYWISGQHETYIRQTKSTEK